ncbi:RRM domain-containing protein, partial [Psidium guajava]
KVRWPPSSLSYVGSTDPNPHSSVALLFLPWHHQLGQIQKKVEQAEREGLLLRLPSRQPNHGSQLLKEFSTFGHVAEVEVAKDAATKRSKGYAFIQYTCQDDAVLALENMDRKKLDGRVVYVELARPGKEAYDRPRTCGPPPPRNDQAAE